MIYFYFVLFLSFFFFFLYLFLVFIFYFFIMYFFYFFFFFFSSRRRHTRWNCDWSSDVCSSDLMRLSSAIWRRRSAPMCATRPRCRRGCRRPPSSSPRRSGRRITNGSRDRKSVV